MHEAVIDKMSSNGTATVSFGKVMEYVEFFDDPIYLEHESLMAGGIKKYKASVSVKIQVPGSRDNVVHRLVDDKYPHKYPAEWAAFKNKQELVPEGFPIIEWAFLTKTEALNLKGIGIHTVEALAQLPDSRIQALGPGGFQLRQKAKDTMEAENSITGTVARTAALEMEDKRKSDVIAQLTAQIAQLQHQMNTMASITPYQMPVPVQEQPTASAAPAAFIPDSLQTRLEVDAKRKGGRPKKILTTES